MEDKSDQKQDNYKWRTQGLALFFRLQILIVMPMLIAIFIGKWLDKKYDSEPWLFLVSVVLAFIISMIGLIRNSINEMKKIK